MKKRRLLKSIVAIIALTAMLMENTYSVMASITTDAIIEADDNVITADDASGSVLTEGEGASDTMISDGNGNDSLIESVSPDREIDISINDEKPEVLISENASVDASDKGIEVSAAGEVTLYVNTDQMNASDTFRLDLNGSSSLDYSIVLDGKMSKSDSDIYTIKGLAGKKLSIKAVDLSSGLKAEYKVRSDGNPQVSLVSADEPEAEKKLAVTSDGLRIKGSGYDDITLSLDASALSDSNRYNIYVDTRAKALYNGDPVEDGVITSLSRSTSGVRLSNLNNKAFTIYIEGRNTKKIKASYTVESIDNGAVAVVLSPSDEDVTVGKDEETEEAEEEEEEEATKRVYTYEDADVSVTATLQYADAIPDDAEFSVIRVTSDTPGYNYDAYIEALNKNADRIMGEEGASISGSNVLLYDVAFFGKDENGNRVELQPEEGSVAVNIRFKKEQIENELNAEEASDVKTVHLPLVDSVKEDVNSTAEATAISASDIKVEVVGNSAGSDKESVDFTISDFSIIGITAGGKILPGPDETFKTVLGNACVHGVVANTLNASGHFETNFATGILYGGANVATCKNDAGNAGVTYIGEYKGSGFFMDKNGNSSQALLYTTRDAVNNMHESMAVPKDQTRAVVRNGAVVIDLKYSKDDIQKRVKTLVDKVAAKSVELANVDSYAFSSVANGGVLDIASKGSGKGTYYITFEEGEYAKKAAGLDIRLSEGQKVVLTIPDTSVVFQQMKVNGKAVGGQPDEDPICQSVILNCPKATYAKTGGSVAAVVLVPKADFDNGTVSAGWLIANNVLSFGSEWHCVWHDMPPADGTSDVIKAKKTVNWNTPTKDQKFKFGLYSYDTNTKTYKLEYEVENNGQEITFPTIYFNEAGTYKYKVIEHEQSDNFAHDPAVYYIEYTVKLDKNLNQYVITNKKITKAASADGSADKCNDNEEISFNNQTKPKVDFEFNITKLFYTNDGTKWSEKRLTQDLIKDLNELGGYGGSWPDGATFTFNIERFDGGPTNSGIRMDSPLPEKKQITLTKDKRTGSFGSVFFEADTDSSHYSGWDIQNGVYTKIFMYKITEVIPKDEDKIPGVYYTDRPIYVKLFVKSWFDWNSWSTKISVEGRASYVNDNSVSGQECFSTAGVDLEFINAYYPGSLKVKKVAVDADGNPVDSDKDFHIAVYRKTSSGSKVYYGLDGKSYLNVHTETVKGNSEITFAPLPNGYKYYVYETDEYGVEVDKDGTVYSVTYSGLDKNNGVELNTCNRDKTVTVTNKRKNGKIRLIKWDAGKTKKLAGAKFVLYKDDKPYNKGHEYEIGSTGTLEIGDLPWGTYYFMETKAPVGYVLPTGNAAKTKSAVIDSATVKEVQVIEMVDDEIFGDVIVYKVDDKGDALTGAEFALYASKGSDATASRLTTTGSNGVYKYDKKGSVQTLVTDSKGILKVTGLPYGDYAIQETKAPADHVIDGTVRSFAITESGAVVAFTFVNPKINANVEFIKVDPTDRPVDGIYFNLYKEIKGVYSIVNTVKSGTNGHVLVEGLGEGNYYFQEAQDKNDGSYLPDDTQHKFSITAADNGTTITLSGVYRKVDGLSAVENTPSPGDAELYKYVLKDKKKLPLEGAEFKLYKMVNNKPLQVGDVYTTGSDGYIRVTGLEWGSYYFLESKAPTGYNLNTDEIKFNITRTDRSFSGAGHIEVSNTPIKGWVDLEKVDKKDTGKKLDGITFELYKGTPEVPGALINTFVTGATVPGMITAEEVGELEYGNYFFKEKATIKGYVLNTEPITFSITENGQHIHLTAKNDEEPGSVILHKYDGKRLKKLDGAKFTLYKVPEGTLQKIGAFFGGNKEGTYTTANGGIIEVGNLAWGTYYFEEDEAPTGYVKSDDQYPFTIDADHRQEVLDYDRAAINDEDTGAIKLIKENEDGDRIAGVKFALYKDNSRYPDDSKFYYTDSNGEIYVDGLAWGEYFFEESEVPVGYEVPADPRTETVTIDATTTVQTVKYHELTFKNKEITGNLDVIKVDDKGNKLTGAQFSLQKLVGNDWKNVKLQGSNGHYSYDKKDATALLKQKLDTDGATLSVTGLPYGSYRMYEEKAPEGFNKVTSPYLFSIDEQDKHIEYNFVNTPVLAAVEFVKIDLEDGSAVSGAVFKLYKYDDASKTTYTEVTELRDTKGVFRYEGLGTGDYFVREWSAPSGYQLITKDYTFSIDADDNGTTVSLDNADRKDTNGRSCIEEPREDGKVKLFKADKETGNPLEGALFDLYKEGDTAPLKKDLASDALGYVKAEGLKWGKYYFIETKAPEGFAADKSKHWFEVNKDNASATVEITLDLDGNELRVDNTPIYAGADLEKQDNDTHKPIKGAEFALFYDDGTDKNIVPGYASMITNADGKISTNKNLKAGKYYFKEIKPAKGYILTDTHYNFTVNEEVMDTIVHAGTTGIAYNPPIPGEVELLKYAESEEGIRTGLKDASFTLYKVRPLIDEVVGTFDTDAEGMIYVSNLKWGTYYFKEVQAPKGYQALKLGKEDLKFTIDENTQKWTGNARLSAKNPPFLGKVKLTKYLVAGDKTTTLEGAKFKFYKVAQPHDLEIVNTEDPDGLYTSASDGTIVIEDLEWGSYYFDEVEAPEGCVIPTPSTTGVLTIDSDNVEDSIKTPISVDVFNKKVYGNASILKIDDKNNGLKGAEFALFTAAGDQVFVTDKGNGVYYYAETGSDTKLVSPEGGLIVVKQLPYGDYYFTETKAPATFAKTNAKFGFTITRNQTEDEEPQWKLTCINTPIKAGVEFTKASSDANHPLDGCIFELYKDGAAADGSDLFIATVTSDDDGRVFFEDLGPGSYHFKEIKTKDDAYELYKGDLKFVITDADKDKVVGLSNVSGNVVLNPPLPGCVALEKYYTVEGIREGTLAGAKFDLYQLNDKGEYEIYNKTPLVVPASGTLSVNNLKWTSYYFVETEAPKGYKFDPNAIYKFDINQKDVGDTPIQVIQVGNERLPGSVEIDKVDSTDSSKLIDGVTFHLYKEYKTKDQADLGTKTTKNGRVSWDKLTWGKYTLIEDATADGYVKNDKEYNFVIDADNLSKSYTGTEAIPNPPIEGYFNLEKKDAVTKEPIESVEFELYVKTENGSSKMDEYKLITNAAGKLEDQNGNTKIGPLKKGSYYLKEIVPDGYIAPTEDLTIDITYNDQLVSFSSDYAVYNTPIKGGVKLLKVDDEKKPLKGAEFTLYATKPRNIGDALVVLLSKKNVYKYGVYKTDDNGALYVYDLPWDTYYFVETKAPDGYEILEKDKEYEFEVNAQNCNATIPIGPIGNNKLPGELEITKVDSANQKAIEGAKFKLYLVASDGSKSDVSAKYGAVNGVFVTNDKGIINVKNVDWGTYFFDEVEAAEGFEPITHEEQVRSKDLIVNASNWSDKDQIMTTQKDTVENDKGYGYVKLIKKFDGHRPDPDKIKGIRFDLHNEKTGDIKQLETDENGNIEASVIGALEYGSYYFTEESVPAGSSYKINDFELRFTIDKSNPINEPLEYEFTNSEILASAQFIKVDPFEYDYKVPTQKGTITGIKFFVYKADGTYVTEVTSGQGGVVKVEHLPMGDYYFLEDADSAKALGFVPSTDKYTFTIGPNDGPDSAGNEKFVDVYKEGELIKAITVPNPKAEGSIRLEKLGKDSTGKVAQISLKDAEFELYEETKGMIMSRVELAKLNKGDEIVVDKLPWGRYYFKEVTPPKGYALPEGDAANSNVVEIDQNSVSQSAFTPLTCQITDDTVRVYVSKRELMGADELPGAQMSLYNAGADGKMTGNPILKWTSTTAPKLLEIGDDLKEGLVVGNTYVIHEIAAPDGFIVSFDITFTVNSDGSVTTDPNRCRVVGSGNGMTIIVDDGPVTVYISKKELGTDVALSGAKLQIRDENGVIESWSSTGARHQLSKVLVPEKDYTLEEVDPPKGYYTAAPITFRVSKGGAIQIVHDESASAMCLASSPSFVGASSAPVTTELIMYDRPIKVEISKKRLSGSDKDYVEGAKLTLSEKVGDEYKPIVSWESTGKPYLVEYGLLKVGGEYKVTETAAPKGYTKADDVYFKVKDFSEFEKTDSDGTVTQKVTVFDPPIKVVISKKASTGEDELPGAVLQVTDADGNEVARFQSQNKQTLITSIESAEKLSADEKSAYAKYNVIYNVKFETGKEYTLKELSAPAGYALAAPVTFRIDENGNQAPSPVVMKDKPLEISISKKDIGTSKNLAGAGLELYNEANELVAAWVSAEKPVLISIRKIGETEAAEYSEVIAKALPAGKYRLHEAKAPEGYKLAEDVTIVIDGSDVKKDDGKIREESMYDYKEGSTSVVGRKEWIAPKDNEGNISADYVYPDIRIDLYRDSDKQGEMDKTPLKSITLKNGATSFAFGDLERYKTSGNENYEYTYKVEEVMSPDVNFTGHELEMKKEGDQNTVVFMVGFENILNQEHIDLNGTKTFTLLKDKNGKILNDVKYDDVQIYLLQNGKRVDIDGDGKEDCVEIKGGAKETNGVAKFSFKQLPKYDLTTGNAYKYTVEETGSNSYAYSITYTDDEVKINNTPKAEPFKVYGVKTWVDPDNAKRPDVTIQLFRDGKLYRETKLSKDNTFSFTGLYEYNLGYGNEEGDIAATADGHKFFYEVKEAGALGYDVKITGSGDEFDIKDGVATVNIKNTIKQAYVEKSGNKFWNDRGDSSKRPPITVYLLATDSTGRKNEEVDRYVIPNTSSRYEFGTKGQKQLPKYDANGKVIEYTIREEELPGYLQVVNGDDITNTPSKVVVSKLDATEHTELPGAVLSIVRKSDGKEVERWTSGSTPHYIEALELGEVYTLNEISAPLGYALASPVDFQVGVNGVEQKVEMFDDPIIGSVTLTKIDATSREKLAGAEFNLYSSDGNVVYATGSNGSYTYSKNGSGVKELVVNGSGELVVDKLPYGTYYFKETKAPKGYELKTEAVNFSITDHGVNVNVTYEDPRILGAVMLTKTGEDGSPLSGAEFELYSKTPSSTGQAAASTVFSDAYYRYGTYTTDSDGKIKVSDLPWDEYYFIETKAPEGYETNRDVTGDPLVYTFSVSADNAGSSAVDLGQITNNKVETGVLGERVPVAEKVSGVLGVRSKPKAGVLGTRVGPATGDASAIALWITLLVACIGTIVWMLASRRKKDGEGA